MKIWKFISVLHNAADLSKLHSIPDLPHIYLSLSFFPVFLRTFESLLFWSFFSSAASRSLFLHQARFTWPSHIGLWNEDKKLKFFAEMSWGERWCLVKGWISAEIWSKLSLSFHLFLRESRCVRFRRSEGGGFKIIGDFGLFLLWVLFILSTLCRPANAITYLHPESQGLHPLFLWKE